MAAFKPYKGGNVPLWALNKLCNTSKHETLLIPFLGAENMIYEADGMRLETGYRESENGEIPVCWVDVGNPNPHQQLQVEVSNASTMLMVFVCPQTRLLCSTE